MSENRNNDPLREALASFIGFLEFILCIVVAVGFFALYEYGKQQDEKCEAPCVVKFPKGMEEDQFRVDYRADHTLRVWRVKNGR